ncbi:hypothetical protein F100043J3_12070 [Mediterraneibacter gnavus]
MKILTVEDDNMIREGISEYLSEFGYTVIQDVGVKRVCKNYLISYIVP